MLLQIMELYSRRHYRRIVAAFYHQNALVPSLLAGSNANPPPATAGPSHPLALNPEEGLINVPESMAEDWHDDLPGDEEMDEFYSDDIEFDDMTRPDFDLW